ncbi:MAG: hypothetical protein Q9195_004064 [Heterodermia aff. obscurata]
MRNGTTTTRKDGRVHKSGRAIGFLGEEQRNSFRGTTVHYLMNETYSGLLGPTCMCVEGLLPQHIRNIIMSQDIEAITAALNSYQDGLNASSTDSVMKLYAPDGVFMAQHSPSAIGTDAIRKAYDGIFAARTLSVKLEILEVIPTAPNWAFARATSAGSTVVKAGGGGHTGQEANHELFIFQKLGGLWKIARYCFSTMNPPS